MDGVAIMVSYYFFINIYKSVFFYLSLGEPLKVQILGI